MSCSLIPGLQKSKNPSHLCNYFTTKFNATPVVCIKFLCHPHWFSVVPIGPCGSPLLLSWGYDIFGRKKEGRGKKKENTKWLFMIPILMEIWNRKWCSAVCVSLAPSRNERNHTERSDGEICLLWVICQNTCMTTVLDLCSCCDRSASISHKFNRPNLNRGIPQWKANI